MRLSKVVLFEYRSVHYQELSSRVMQGVRSGISSHPPPEQPDWIAQVSRSPYLPDRTTQACDIVPYLPSAIERP